MTRTSTRKSSRVLTLHHLIVELSYWGSSVRLLLLGFLAALIMVIRISELESLGMSLGAAVTSAAGVFIYAVGSFLILEIGYLLIARAYRLVRGLDRLIFFGVESVLAIIYFLPYFAMVPNWLTIVSRYFFVAVLLILGMRLLIGLLYGKKS